MSPESEARREVKRIDTAAKRFVKAGYELPKSLLDALANWDRLLKPQAHPAMPNFALAPDKFEKEFDRYAHSLDTYDRETRAAEEAGL